MADPTKPATPKAATPALVSVTVAKGRTVHLPNPDDPEAPVTAYGPGSTLKVDAAEAKRLRDLGFAEPEPAKPAEKVEE